MEVVVPIAQRLYHHVDIIGRAYVLIVRSFADAVSDAVNCEGIIEIYTESCHHANPISEPQGLIPHQIRYKCRYDDHKSKKEFEKVMLLKHDSFIGSQVAQIDSF